MGVGSATHAMAAVAHADRSPPFMASQPFQQTAYPVPPTIDLQTTPLGTATDHTHVETDHTHVEIVHNHSLTPVTVGSAIAQRNTNSP